MGYIFDIAESPIEVKVVGKLKALDCLAWLDHKATVNKYKNELQKE